MNGLIGMFIRAGGGGILDKQSTSVEKIPPLESQTGSTRDGVPLSFNRAPASDLDPWIARMMVAMAPTNDTIPRAGLLCNDAGYVRTAIKAEWTAKTADGELELSNESFVCGQHSTAMPMGLVGGIVVSGFMLRPGTMRALWGVEDGALIDRIKPMSHLGIEDASLTGLYQPGMTPEEWMLSIENWLRNVIAHCGGRKPEAVSQHFEVAAFADPNQSINNFADRHSITPRTLQRITKRDFGLSPKQIMRRARTLDLATRLCGVADEFEGEDIYLRYFDQSHQIREFTSFLGMTPRQFTTDRQGLLTLSLEVRQARRLEMLDRIAPDAIRPWMSEPFVPPLNTNSM